MAEEESKPTILERLTPDYAMAQFAGSIGIASVGGGWAYGGRDQWESELSMGFIPKGTYEHVIPTFTLKQSFLLRDIAIKDTSLAVTPFTCSIFVNYVCNRNYWLMEPEKYDPPYYGLPTAVRLSMSVGQRVTHDLKSGFAKSVSFYYELSTTDLYLISAITNSYLKPRDYLSLALGVKLHIR